VSGTHKSVEGGKVVLIPEKGGLRPKQEIQQQTLPIPVKINKRKPCLEWSSEAGRGSSHAKHWLSIADPRGREGPPGGCSLKSQQEEEGFFRPSNSSANERQSQRSRREATILPAPSSAPPHTPFPL